MKINLENISYKQGDFLLELSTQFSSGGLISLLGSSGSGKTTLLRLIAGFNKPDSGKISIDGLDITKISPQDRNMGFLFQNLALFPHYNVEKNISYGLVARNWSKQNIKSRVKELLKLIKLEGFEKRSINKLSGGEKQRVALARAIAPKPPLILLDEPLSALDQEIRLQLGQDIKRIQRETGITMIFVTHDQQEALTLSDNVIVMKDGNIIEEGTPRTLYSNPQKVATASFIGSGLILSTQDAKKYNLIERIDTDSFNYILIRPEWISIENNALNRATITEVHYLGKDIKIDLLDLENSFNFTIILSSDKDYKIGEKIFYKVNRYKTLDE